MKLSTFSRLVALPYTLFGLPWLVTSICLVNLDPVIQLKQLSFVQLFMMFVAFFSARTAAMSFNRLIDEPYDTLNPRTQDRALVTKEVKKEHVTYLAWVAAGLFIAACYSINQTLLMMSPIAFFLLWGYSYVKLFSPWYHVVMAINHGLLPIFVWTALTGRVSIAAIYLALAITAFIASNDIIYGIQDMRFDRAHRLYSAATVWGVRSSLRFATSLQLLFIVLLFEVGLLMGLPWQFYLGVFFSMAIIAFLNWQLELKNRSIQHYMFCNNVWIGVCLMIFSVWSLF